VDSIRRIVEPIFANIRIQKRLDNFTVLSKAKVDVQWKSFALIHNLVIHRQLFDILVRQLSVLLYQLAGQYRLCEARSIQKPGKGVTSITYQALKKEIALVYIYAVTKLKPE